MKIVAADWLPYQLDFKQPWQTAQGRILQREGRLLRLRSASGLTGWGDAAALPEFGISHAAAAAFAEECATLDLVAQMAGLSLAHYLAGQVTPQTVAVNAVSGPISLLAPATCPTGFPIIKLKVGIAPVAEELQQLAKLSAHLPPGTRWRLDANAAWTFAEAQAFIDGCRPLPIEGLEEPLAQPSPEALRRLQAVATFPLAIDESTHLLDAAFWQAPSVARLIIKPARCAGLLASMALALRAQASGIEVIVTSSLDSACGLIACAQLAAAIAPRATHGLASGDCFTNDTGPTPSVADGRLWLPRQAGLGFSYQPT